MIEANAGPIRLDKLGVVFAQLLVFIVVLRHRKRHPRPEVTAANASIARNGVMPRLRHEGYEGWSKDLSNSPQLDEKLTRRLTGPTPAH
jgi:hypothetical protein